VKVALVCKKYSLQEGGLERYTYFLSRELIRAGHEAISLKLTFIWFASKTLVILNS
jgi:hypothetical protein